MRKIDYSNITKEILNEYVSHFDVVNMQPIWSRLRTTIVTACRSPYAEQIYPAAIEDVLKGKYEDLVKIYQDYAKTVHYLPVNCDEELKDLFNYSGRSARYCKVMQPTIARFFMDHADEMDIHVCFYCEMSYVNVYSARSSNGNPTSRNHFDLDHFLPKSDCPIVGLSFYNFVPSCSVCNEKLKRDKLIGEGFLVKSSPTSDQYEFDKDVHLKIKDTNGGLINYIKDIEDVEIEFTGKTAPYKDEIRELRYVDRYNYHKMEAVRLFNIVADYPDSMLDEIASLFGDGKSKDDIENDLLYAGHRDDKHPRVFDKLHRDIIAQRKGQI